MENKELGNVGNILSELKEDTRIKLQQLTDDQRMDLFADYCKFCGCIQPEEGRGCQCWNDE